MKYVAILLFPVLFSSCNILNDISTTGAIIIFAVLMLASIAMFFYVVRKRKQADNVALKFANDLKIMVDKIEGSDNKIKALEITVERINKDEQYKKDTVWRDKVLSKVYQQMASIYYKDSNFVKVIDACTRIVSVEPGHMMSYYNRGTLYGNMEKYTEAEKDLTEAIALDSSYANTYNNRGMVYDKMGEYSKAITDYTYALELEETAIIYYNRANAYNKAQMKQEALIDYNKALDVDPSNDLGIRHNVELMIKNLK